MNGPIIDRDPGDEDQENVFIRAWYPWSDDVPQRGGPYELSDPKHPDHYDTYTDIYDLRDPFMGRD